MLLFVLRQSFLSMLLVVFTFTVSAAERNYTITAPDGVQIAVQESGNLNGKPIIFIHGLLGSHITWEKQLQDKKLQSWRLITFDMRGHGLSGKPLEEKAYRNGKLWADDLAAVIKVTHAVKPLLVGWSLGGAVITNYLATRGDAGLSGVIYVDGVVELTADLIPPHPAIYQNMIAEDLTTHLDGQREFLRLCFYQQPDDKTFERLLANAALVAWPMQRAVPSMSIAVEKGLQNLRIPALFIYGKHDALVNTQASLARATGINPSIQARIYDNSGHTPFIEETERFNQELDAFAASLWSQPE